MKKLTTIWLLIIVSATAVFAQSKDEQEILKFNSEYEQAQINRDVAFFERVLADDYTFSRKSARWKIKHKPSNGCESKKKNRPVN